MDRANSLHALTYYGEYNERFDLIAAVELTVKQGGKGAKSRYVYRQKGANSCFVFVVMHVY